MSARSFVLQATLRENIIELRRALGSIDRPLSLRRFADQITRRHPAGKVIDFKNVERWEREEDPVEPDTLTLAIMATLAGVSFEKFVLGKGASFVELSPGVIEFRLEELERVSDAQIARARDMDREQKTRRPTAKKKAAGKRHRRE